MNFVLKWDGDMIATSAFSRHVAMFKSSKVLMMYIFGANLHPDGEHLIQASDAAREEIQQAMTAPMSVGNWTAPFTDSEPRLFPRLLARYDTGFWWCESLSVPWRCPSLIMDTCPNENYVPGDCSYLHLKYCKHDPFENFSDGFAALIESGVKPGPVMPRELRAASTSLGGLRP